jgi:hypothetical protein
VSIIGSVIGSTASSFFGGIWVKLAIAGVVLAVIGGGIYFIYRKGEVAGEIKIERQVQKEENRAQQKMRKAGSAVRRDPRGTPGRLRDPNTDF